ncbi:hypothetical protein V6N13_127351 [Hibiscus sabdariffa]
MSMFEIVAMFEKLGITYNVKVFWQLADKPIEVEQLKIDADVMEMVSNLPRDHYVHLYLEEVVGFSETKMDEPGLGEVEMDEPGLAEAEMDEPDIGEPEMDEPELGEPEMDEHVMDEPELGEPEMDEHEYEVRLESESDSEDEEYVAGSESSCVVFSFSDGENEIVSSEDEVDEESNVNVGLGSDEVDVQSESGHSDSLHSVGEADSDGSQSKPRFPEFNRKTDMSNPTLKVGLIFANKTVLKEPIKMYGIKNRYSVKLKRNDNKRIQVTCKSGCTWVLWATPINGEDPNTGTWQIRPVHGEHNCLREFVNPNGLIEAVLEQFPYSEHRTCVRHLYSNSKTNGFTGKTLKDQLWKATRITYEREFQSAMAELKGLSKNAWDWLAPKDPRMWLKSHFSVRCKSDMLLNNNYECFNKLILEARDKPIISLLESIRTKLMQRLAKRKDMAEKWTRLLCWPIHAGGHMYQVSCSPSHQHSVNIEAWTCSCRKWELTDRSEKYVHQSYFVSTQRAIYSHLISPVRGEKQWTVEETMEPILPPLFRRPPGRPHKKRKRKIDEPTPQLGKVSRTGVKIFCKKCEGTGHNIRTCKRRVGGNIRGPGQTSTSSARAPRISKLSTRRLTTTPTSHGENSPRPTPTSHAGNSPRPTLLPTQPSEVHTTRWMPTPTTTNHVGTPPTIVHGGTSPRPTPLPTQPSQGHTVRWMSTSTTTHAGTPPTSAHGGTSPRPTPLPTQPSQGHTVRWMPTPTTTTTHLS